MSSGRAVTSFLPPLPPTFLASWWLSRGDPCRALSPQIAASDYDCLGRKKQAVLMAWTNWISWRRFRTQLSHFLWLSKKKHTHIYTDTHSKTRSHTSGLLWHMNYIVKYIYGIVSARPQTDIVIFTHNCKSITHHTNLRLFDSFARNQRSLPMRRCGRLWAAGKTQHWLKTTRKASPGFSRQTTPCWWSPPALSTSARETATLHRLEVS